MHEWLYRLAILRTHSHAHVRMDGFIVQPLLSDWVFMLVHPRLVLKQRDRERRGGGAGVPGDTCLDEIKRLRLRRVKERRQRSRDWETIDSSCSTSRNCLRRSDSRNSGSISRSSSDSGGSSVDGGDGGGVVLPLLVSYRADRLVPHFLPRLNMCA